MTQHSIRHAVRSKDTNTSQSKLHQLTAKTKYTTNRVRLQQIKPAAANKTNSRGNKTSNSSLKHATAREKRNPTTQKRSVPD
jgi:hypothetical protein